MFYFVEIALTAAALFSLAMACAMVREKALRGALLSFAAALAAIAAGSFLYLHPHPTALSILFTVFLAGIVLSLISWFPSLNEKSDEKPIERYDERDHMFARANLKHHPDLARRYHDLKPENRKVDEIIWSYPELGEEGGRFYDRYVSSIATSAFALLDKSYDPLNERETIPRTPPDPDKLLNAIRLAAFHYGAVDVGVAPLEPHFLYAVAGRQAENWGETIETNHTTALVFIVPMAHTFIRHAPTLPTLLESARQYVESAKIAHIAAEMIRQNGAQARAHVDSHYEVICAPLAERAGLGRVGRIGIFMHRIYGPSVRISVVTTDIKLPFTEGDHAYMEHFCRICKKCADNCPPKAISRDEKPVSRGAAHWSILQERCYNLWRKMGTDCAICIRSCPFSKPDTSVHRIVRWFIRRNPLNQRLALWGDDLFYGRKVKIRTKNPNLEKLTEKIQRKKE